MTNSPTPARPLPWPLPKFAGVLAALALGGAALAWALAGRATPAGPWAPAGVLACAAFTLLGYRLALRALRQAGAQFVQALLSATLAKLMLSLVFVLTAALLLPADGRLPFVLCYFGGYFAFTAFEVSALLANLRSISKKGDK